MVASRHIKRQNASLPVNVRRSKTSLLKLAILHFIQCSDAVTIYRFLGTSMDSTAARPLLRSLCIQLRRIYSKDPDVVASDFKTLCEVHPKSKAYNQRTALIPVPGLLGSDDG